MHKTVIAPLLAVLSLCWLNSIHATESFYTVRDVSINTRVSLGGTVVPAREVTLSAQQPGRIEWIAGEEGTYFNKNNTLLELDTHKLQAKRRAAVAELMNTEATLRNANVQYSRELWSPSQRQAMGGMGLPNMFDQFFTRQMTDMMNQNNTVVDRQADLYNYGSRIDQARGALVRAQSQIEQIDALLRDTKSTAPFDGFIINKLVEVGDTVQMGQPLLKFADMSKLLIEVNVPARLVMSLKLGMQVVAHIDVLQQPVTVEVVQIYPTADPQRHTVKVKFQLNNVFVEPGQYAQVEINDLNAPKQNLRMIPRGALVWRGSLPGVYVVKGDKRSLRLVRIGHDIDAQYVSILSGLKANDIIVNNPSPGMSSGWVRTSTH